MSKIIVFRKLEQVDSYFSPVEIDLSDSVSEVVYASIKDWNVYKSIFNSPENIIVLDYSIVSSDPTRLDLIKDNSKASLLLLVNFEFVGDREWELQEVCSQTSTIEGVIDVSKNIKVYYPMLKSILRKNKALGMAFGIGNIGENLTRALTSSFNELSRIKKLHERLVPMRSEKIKGLEITSKFAAGLSSGGEFFDIFKNDSSAVLLLSSAKSYVSSSVVLTHFEKFSEQKDFSKNSFEEFLEEIINECRELELIKRDEPELLQLALIHFDLKKLVYTGYMFGNFSVLSLDSGLIHAANQYPLNENFVEKSFISGALKRSDKLAIVSPGVKMNLEKGIEGKSVDEYCLGELKSTPKVFLNEVFFQLKKGLSGEFLNHDSSILHIEVDQNAIIEV